MKEGRSRNKLEGLLGGHGGVDKEGECFEVSSDRHFDLPLHILQYI